MDWRLLRVLPLMKFVMECHKAFNLFIAILFHIPNALLMPTIAATAPHHASPFGQSYEILMKH